MSINAQEDVSFSRSRPAVPPRDYEQRLEMAHRVGISHSQLHFNRSDPHAYNRAHSRVMNGLFDEHDLKDGNVGV